MVDIHCHILPNVDDGAESLEESLKMLRKASAAGVEIMVATPHLLKGTYEIEFSQRENIISDLQKAADEGGIEIQIKPGLECYLTPEILEDADELRNLTINNNGKYILVEFPMQIVPQYAKEVIFNLIVKGVTPILAHPERNMEICQDVNILFDLVMEGCLAQLNVGSILGHFGRQIRKTSQIMLNHRLAHVVASDMHSEASPTLFDCVAEVEKTIGPERASRMFTEIPRQIVAGGTFFKEPPQRFELARRSHFFRRKE